MLSEKKAGIRSSRPAKGLSFSPGGFLQNKVIFEICPINFALYDPTLLVLTGIYTKLKYGKVENKKAVYAFFI